MVRSNLRVMLLSLPQVPAQAQQTSTHYLSGTNKDHTVQGNFYCTKGQNSGERSKIAVPSN